MRNGKIKSFPFAVKLTIVLAVLAVVFFVLSVVSVKYSVSRTVSAIDSIGTVEFSDTSKERIDLALKYYAELDPNLDLTEKIANAETLTDAKNEYVRLAIKKAYLADKNGEPEASVSEYVAQAREIFNEYCPSGECKKISNYADLTALEEKYSAGATENAAASNTPAPAEEIELC